MLFQVCSNGALGPPYLGLCGHFTKLTAPPAWPLLECTRQFPVSALHIWPPCLPATHPWLPATWTPLMPKRLKTNYQQKDYDNDGSDNCDYNFVRGCSHTTSAKIRGFWTPPPPSVSNGHHLASPPSPPRQQLSAFGLPPLVSFCPMPLLLGW